MQGVYLRIFPIFRCFSLIIYYFFRHTPDEVKNALQSAPNHQEQACGDKKICRPRIGGGIAAKTPVSGRTEQTGTG
jgi:hypothetical protein